MRILACAAIFLVPAAAAAQAPIGLFTELQVETKVDLLAWPESCGKLPVASRIPGRGQVSADVRGGVLLLRAKKAPLLIRSDACTDPDPAMSRGRPVHEENRWELFCSTPAGSAGARTESLKIAFTPPDGLTTTLLTRWGSECKGSEVVTRTFTRTVPTPVAPLAAVEPGEEAPDGGVPAEPGEVVVVAAHGGARASAASAQAPEEKVELPDVELRALEDDEDYLLPVRELGRKGSFLPLILGAGLLLLGGLALGAVLLRRRRPAARPRAAEPAPAPVPAPEAAPARAPAPAATPAPASTPAPAATPTPARPATPAPEGPPPAKLVDDPRADHTAPMTAAVMPPPPASVQVDPTLGASVFDPRNADTLQMRASVLRRLDAEERAALDKARFCPACGKQVPVGARFCPYCRSKMPGEPGKP